MFHVIAILTVKDRAKTTQFETQAVQIMARYGGELLVAFSCLDKAPEQEVHHLRFPDAESFKQYREDSELQALSTLRSEAIADTQAYMSSRVLDYNGD